MAKNDEGRRHERSGSNGTGRRSLLRPLASAAGAALLVSTIGSWPSSASADGGSEKVTILVDEECVAPAPQTSNYCSIRGVLPAQRVAGSDISWEVTVFFNDHWRIQVQAFVELPDSECQYPIRVWGSYRAPELRSASFVIGSGIDLGITPTEFPTLTLTLDRVRIDTGRPTCG